MFAALSSSDASEADTSSNAAAYRQRTNGDGVQVEDTRIAVVMVGLPARGKSLIAQKGKSFNFTLQAEQV